MSTAAIFGTTPTQAFGRNALWSLAPASGTLTFNQNYQGLVQSTMQGTGLAGGLLTAGTATVTGHGLGVVNAAGTLQDDFLLVNATVGQTLILTQSFATTITSHTLRVGAYLASLG